MTRIPFEPIDPLKAGLHGGDVGGNDPYTRLLETEVGNLRVRIAAAQSEMGDLRIRLAAAQAQAATLCTRLAAINPVQGMWEGREVYRTLAGCPVICLEEPRAGLVKIMYIHAQNHYGYGQFHQGLYDVKSLTDWSEK